MYKASLHFACCTLHYNASVMYKLEEAPYASGNTAGPAASVQGMRTFIPWNSSAWCQPRVQDSTILFHIEWLG